MPVYSHSQLATFEECPQRYKFRYIDRILKPEAQGIEAFTGSRVHETLEKLYDDLQYTKLNSLEALLDYYHKAWRRSWEPGIRIIREGLSEENYRDFGARCIERYYQRFTPFDQSPTLKTEFRLVFALDPHGRYQMQGVIDRLARRAPGAYEIHDYKTSSTLPSQAQLDGDRQLALYHFALKACWADVESVDLIWHYLAFDTTLVSHRSPEELQECSQKTIELIEQIENCRQFEPVKSSLCAWCEYRSVCPLWKHVLAVESMSPEAMAADGGVQLANDYAQTKSEIDRLAAILGELRVKVLQFAREQQTNVIQGTGVRVSAQTRELKTFPDRDRESWAKLEEFVRTIGKWEEASELSPARLAAILKDKRWPKEWLEELDRFTTTRTVATVRLARADDGKDQEDQT
jgi:putative RecB family exonuclease